MASLYRFPRCSCGTFRALTSQTSTGALLDQFGVTRTSFNGDLAHLLGFAGEWWGRLAEHLVQ